MALLFSRGPLRGPPGSPRKSVARRIYRQATVFLASSRQPHPRGSPLAGCSIWLWLGFGLWLALAGLLLRISAGFLDSRSGLDLTRLRSSASGFHLLGFWFDLV